MVIATFFNLSPALARGAIPAAWERTTPAQVLDARLAAADAALRRALGDRLVSPELREPAALAWPDDDHLVLWHAQTQLREFRGDAHIAALLLEGLRGIDALVVHAATGDDPVPVLQGSRAWPDEDWAAAVEHLRSRGLVNVDGDAGLRLTDEGHRHRDRVEGQTDASTVVDARLVAGDVARWFAGG